MSLLPFLKHQIFLPLMQLVIRCLLLPGLMLDDWWSRMRLKRLGDVLSVERIAPDETGVFCVFHLYQPYGVPRNVLGAIATLKRLGVQVVAVTNTPLPAADVDLLKPHLHTYIHRRNFGRDFGGYRRGVLHVLDHHKPTRLLILNDSLFFAERGLEAFFKSLCGEGPFIGASENHELSHHVGSYALSFGPEVFADPRFRQYWEDYQSTELRPEVIWKGEAALSKLVIKTMKIKPKIIYSLQRLGVALEQASWRELAISAARMPLGYGGQNPLRQLVRDARKPARDVLPMSKAKLLDNAGLTLPIGAEELIAEMVSQYRSEVERDLLAYVFRGSQIHWGSLLLTQYLEMPIIKLDLVLRSIYSIGELKNFAPFLTAEEFAEFHHLVTARGEPLKHGTLKQKLMMMTGLM